MFRQIDNTHAVTAFKMAIKLNSFPRILVIFVVAFTFVVLTVDRAAVADDNDLDRIAKAWTQRRQAFTSARYKLSLTRLIPKGFHTRDRIAKQREPEFPPTDIFAGETTDLTVHFGKGWMRGEYEQMIYYYSAKLFVPDQHCATFDGKNSFFKKTRDKHADEFELMFSISTVHTTMDAATYPVFFAHGIMTARSGLVSFKNWADGVSMKGFKVEGRPSVDGHQLVVLRRMTEGDGAFQAFSHAAAGNAVGVLRSITEGAGAFEEFWVDPANGAVIRWINFRKMKAVTQIDIEHRKEDGVLAGWVLRRPLPDADRKMQLRDHVTVVVDAAEFDLKDLSQSRFQLKPDAGDLVTLEDKKYYRATAKEGVYAPFEGFDAKER